MASCCCVECKPCNGRCLPVAGLFKCRRPAQQLRRAFGNMKVGGGTRRRRRRAGSFSSVRAVFWPLMSMRSEADARADDAIPPSAPSAAAVTDDGAGAGAASTTAARVLALQARLGEDGGEAEGETEAEAARAAAKASRGALSLSLSAAASREQRGKGGIVVSHGGGEVEAACRSFEAHLMEMLVEERRVLDLTDVEELLCCWEKLRCPAFVRLVGRFYGELCMDLFSSSAASSEPEDPLPERLMSLVVG